MNETITISTQEYEALKDKIKALESEIASFDKKIEHKDDMIISYQDAIDYLDKEITIVDRIFYWKNIISDIKKDLEIYDT